MGWGGKEERTIRKRKILWKHWKHEIRREGLCRNWCLFTKISSGKVLNNERNLHQNRGNWKIDLVENYPRRYLAQMFWISKSRGASHPISFDNHQRKKQPIHLYYGRCLKSRYRAPKQQAATKSWIVGRNEAKAGKSVPRGEQNIWLVAQIKQLARIRRHHASLLICM